MIIKTKACEHFVCAWEERMGGYLLLFFTVPNPPSKSSLSRPGARLTMPRKFSVPSLRGPSAISHIAATRGREESNDE